MNNPVESSEVLNARQHREYLAAMAIEWWIPKDQAIEMEALSLVDSAPDKIIEVESTGKASGGPLSAGSSSAIDSDSNQDLDLDSKQEPAKVLDSNTAQKPVPAQTTNSTTETLDIDIELDPSQVCFSTKQSLKMVNWQSSSSEESKNLLIICRHKTDQPANSFAQKNSPSRFMQSYISALSRFNSESAANAPQSQPEHDFSFHFAHLAEAGIGDNNLQLVDVLQRIKPDLVLVLGDESMLQLSGHAIPVASLRGRLIEMNGFKAVVSYHPYSLIKNPKLKVNAYEDLVFIYQYLTSQTA
ncbi:MAG: hypothetical protein Q9M92_12465 [Enterobacterales bacterium]|nr:hypothetical protein [Enterobacterales bacterium]